MNVWDDPYYASERERIESLPLFMSYPRTGAHWINAWMELYFDRPRLKEIRATFLPKERNDWMWFHDHDIGPEIQLELKHDNVLYLYRNPVDTLYSWIIYNFNNGQDLFNNPSDNLDLESCVEATSNQYQLHLYKWLVSEDRAKTHVRYENFRKAPIKEFRKIQEHFTGDEPLRGPFDDLQQRAHAAYDVVTPEALSARRTEDNTLSDFMKTQEYKDGRKLFTEKYEEKINKAVITEDLKPFFKDV